MVSAKAKRSASTKAQGTAAMLTQPFVKGDRVRVAGTSATYYSVYGEGTVTACERDADWSYGVGDDDWVVIVKWDRLLGEYYYLPQSLEHA